ncbi:MAG TPA: AAA family ATPase, partial [Solirubrobacteraceae bacterium]
MEVALGRDTELAQLDELLASVRGGSGGTLVLRGIAGVGKSLLLGTVMAAAQDVMVMSVAGVQSESDLAFGALSALVQPLLPGINALPVIQADSLRAAVGLASGSQVERLACHVAVHR